MRLSLLLVCICQTRAYITPLTDACSPYLCDQTSSYVLRWGVGPSGRLLYNSDVLDISREGIRYIEGFQSVSTTYYTLAQSECVAGASALCELNNSAGSIFPTGEPMVYHGSSAAHALTSLVEADSACSLTDTGDGRVYTSGTRYDISVCNVQKGRYSMVYIAGKNLFALHQRTFGPMAYVLVLLLCTVNMTGVACVSAVADDQHSAMTLYVANATCSACVAIYFLAAHTTQNWTTSGDSLYLAFTLTSCVGYCVSGFLLHAFPDTASASTNNMRKVLVQQGACLHAIDTLSIMIYHTPETPYSSLLLIMLAARAWSRITRCADPSEDVTWWLIADAVICGTHLALLAELGVLPQVRTPSTWPAVVATVFFCGYVWVHCDCNVIPLIGDRKL